MKVIYVEVEDFLCPHSAIKLPEYCSFNACFTCQVIAVQEVEKVFSFSPYLLAMFGGSASSRKSSLWGFTQKLILESEAAPEWISQVFLIEATLKGTRTATKKKSRVAASYDALAKNDVHVLQ